MYENTPLHDVYNAITDVAPRDAVLEDPDDADESSSSSDDEELTNVDNDTVHAPDESQDTPRDGETRESPMRTRRREHTSWKERFADSNYDPTPSAVTPEVKDPPKPKRVSTGKAVKRKRKSNAPEEYIPQSDVPTKRSAKKGGASRKRKSGSATSSRSAKKTKIAEAAISQPETSSPPAPIRKRIIHHYEDVKLPETILRILDFWVRQLCLLLRRVDEANLWSDCLLVEVGLSTGRSTVAKQWKNLVLKRDKESSVMNYLTWAEKRGIRTYVR